MRCAACHHSFDAIDDTDVPAVCPECGSEVGRAAVAVATSDPLAAEPQAAEAVAVEPIAFEQAEPVAAGAAVATRPKKGMRQAINDMFLSLLFVAAIVIAALSTYVAIVTMKERDELKVQAEKSELTLGKVVDAAANSAKLKGASNAKAREEILGPAISYYQQSGWELRKNPENLERAAAAYQRSAGLQAKTGKGGLAGDLQSVAELLNEMQKADYDVARYPSLYQNALKSTLPLEWGLVTDTPREIHAFKLLQAFVSYEPALQSLARLHPQATVFREDLAGLSRISGSLQALVPDRQPFAVGAWTTARDTLETLVRDQPGNADYQARLVEALTSLANLQKQESKDEAIANLKRAVEVREQMAQANPEDKKLAADLAKVKSDLAKLQPAG